MKRAVALGLGVGLGALALYGVVLALYGFADADGVGGSGYDRFARMNLLMIGIAAFTAAAGHYEQTASRRDLRDLRPVLRCGEAEFDRLCETFGRSARPRTALAVVLGSLLGVAIPILAAEDIRHNLRDPHPASLLLIQLGLFALLGKRALDTVAMSRAFAELGYRQTRVRLFEPELHAAFGRPGLRLSINWLVGSAVASLLFVDASAPRLVAAVLVGTLGLAFSCLLLPARGIHRRLREAKRAELRRVRAAIQRECAALFPPDEPVAAEPERGGDAARLPALVAYEGRVEAVREWPFDTPALLRFAALALLATGSWVGGALVERLLGLALE